MAEDSIDSAGTPCTLQDITAIVEAKRLYRDTKESINEKLNKLNKTLEDIESGKLGAELQDAALGLLIEQAGALAAVAADQAANAASSLIAAALEAIFKAILEIVMAGPAIVLGLLQKPAQRAIDYGLEERAYLKAAQDNFSRISDAMNKAFAIEGSALYQEKLRSALKNMQNSINYFTSLVASIESQSFFNRAVYEKALFSLKEAINDVRIETELSKIVKNRIETNISDFNQKTKVKDQQELLRIRGNYNTKSNQAKNGFNKDINDIRDYYIPVLNSDYKNLLKKKNKSADSYFNYVLSLDKQKRTKEATDNSIPGAASISSIKSQFKSNDVFKRFSNITGSVQVEKKYASNLSGMVDAINGSENDKNTIIKNAKFESDFQIKGAKVQSSANTANNTRLGLQQFYKETGAREAVELINEAYFKDRTAALSIISEEMNMMATNLGQAFLYYKKRQNATKGVVLILPGFLAALNFFEGIVKQTSSVSKAITTPISNVVIKQLRESVDIASSDTTGTKVSKSKLAADCVKIYAKLRLAESTVAATITDSLIDLLNAGRNIEEIVDEVERIKGEIEKIPDWDGQTGPFIETTATGGWVYTDRKASKKNFVASPYVAATTQIASLTIVAPVKIISGEDGKAYVRDKINGINSLFIKLLNHNNDSTEILRQIEVPPNPYMDILIAKLESLGLDKILDLLEAGAFVSSMVNLLSGVFSYDSSQRQCGDQQPIKDKDRTYLRYEEQKKEQMARYNELANYSRQTAPYIDDHFTDAPTIPEEQARANTNGEGDPEYSGQSTVGTG